MNEKSAPRAALERAVNRAIAEGAPVYTNQPSIAATLTKKETLQALEALEQGVWDDPALMKCGPIHYDLDPWLRK